MDEYQAKHIEQLTKLNKTLDAILCTIDVKLAPDLPARVASLAHCLDRRPDLLIKDQMQAEVAKHSAASYSEDPSDPPEPPSPEPINKRTRLLTPSNVYNGASS